MLILKKLNCNLLINYFLIGYAICLPISKAGVNFFEILILLLWVFQGDWKTKLEQYKNNYLTISIIAFILFSIISIIWASSIVYGLDYVAKYRHLLMILVIYTSLNRNFVKYIFSAFIIGMFMSEILSYSIFFEILKYKNISPHDPSPFMSHTDYSVYLAFTSILLLFRFIDIKESLKARVVYGLFLLSVIGNLFVNGGRTGQVTFIILIFITFFSYYNSKFKGILVSFILLCTIFISAYNISPNFYNRINQAKTDVENMIKYNDYTGSFATRVSLWIMGIDKFSNHFVVGSGIGNEINDLDKYAIKHGFNYKHLNGFSDHHNTFITIGIQLGVVGLFLILFIFYSIASLKFSSLRYKIYNLTFIVGFTMWSFGGHTMHLMNSMIFFSFFAGIFNSISYFEQEDSKA